MAEVQIVCSHAGSSAGMEKSFELMADAMIKDNGDGKTLKGEEAVFYGESCSRAVDDHHKQEKRNPMESLITQCDRYATTSESMDDNPCGTSSGNEEESHGGQNFTSDKESSMQEQIRSSLAGDRAAVGSEPRQRVSRSRTERLLRSTNHPKTDDSESSSEDERYEPIEEHKKTIQVGSDFQAVIPTGLSAYGDAPAYENEDRLLWDPSKIKDENALNEYLCNVQRDVDRKLHMISSIPRGRHIRDDEQALFLLLQCDNNIEEAERRRKMQAVPPTDVMSLWSEDECRNFEDGLRLYGKNFHEIHHNKVRTRSVYELAHFYYLWKKTERHDIFAAKTRAEKRKYSLNPGVVDHMDRFLEEQEVELHQLMSPQALEPKVETTEEEHPRPNSGSTSTGRTTVTPPSLHDKGAFKGDHHGPSKRLHQHHHDGEVFHGSFGSVDQIQEHSSPKKSRTGNPSSSSCDQHSPRKQKLKENSKETAQDLENASSLLFPTSSPNVSHGAAPGAPACASEQGGEPKLITNCAGSCVATREPSTLESRFKKVSSDHLCKSLNSEPSSDAQTASARKLGSVAGLVSIKSSYISSCVRKQFATESLSQ